MGSARVIFDRWDGRYAARMAGVRSSAVRDLFAAASRPDVISLSGGMPDVRRVPHEAVTRATRDAMRHDGPSALQYGGSEGRYALRETIVGLMGESGVRLGPDDIIVTAGAQQGLDLLARVFLDPGDVVIAEGPTYVGALQAFSVYQPDIHCIPMDEDGMRVDLLEEELRRLGPKGAKFIYTIPNFQNPAGVTLVPERRRRLLELAREYDIPVVEDDPYGRLRYEGGHILPLRALDPDVIYLGTFSKILAPGLRLGWMSAPKPILARVLLAKQAADLCGSAFSQSVAEHYMTGTGWRRVLADLTATYGARRDAMLAALGEFFPDDVTWTHPEGGFFVWVTLPAHLDTKALLAEAVEHGVTFVPGSDFFPDGRGANCMRLAFCYESPEQITEGVRRLAEVCEDKLELYRAFVAAGAVPAAARVEEGVLR
ncbi:MAG: PLP-dependent aminotransferase family protein [Coriobacteriia bacterium]|nr:PLP-dependent aminotransferase family protein [Coriobacteriia bacterium]